MAKRQKTAQIALRVDPDLKEKAEDAARADHRSLTSLIEKLLLEYIHESERLARRAPTTSISASTFRAMNEK